MGVKYPSQTQAMVRQFSEIAARVPEHGIDYRCFSRRIVDDEIGEGQRDAYCPQTR